MKGKKYTEKKHQQCFIKYCKQNHIPVWGSASGIPLPDIRMVMYLKSVGVIAEKGEPDIFIPIVKRNQEGIIISGGLFIELKKIGGRPSKEQKEKVKYYSENGYTATFAYGFEEAIKILNNYLN